MEKTQTQQGVRHLHLNGEGPPVEWHIDLRWHQVIEFDALMQATGGRDLLNMVREMFVYSTMPKALEMATLFFVACKGQNGIDSVEAAGQYLYEHGRIKGKQTSSQSFDIYKALISAAEEAFPEIKPDESSPNPKDAADAEGEDARPTV